eukprot:6887996-Karenia_brevis.AAC.1
MNWLPATVLLIVTVRNKKEFPHCDLIQLSVIHDHPAASADRLVRWIFFGREGWESPIRVPFFKLASLDVLLDGLLDPFRVRTIEPDKLSSDLWSSRVQAMLEALHRGPRRIG